MQDGQKRPMGIQNWGDQLEPDHISCDNASCTTLQNLPICFYLLITAILW